MGGKKLVSRALVATAVAWLLMAVHKHGRNNLFEATRRLEATISEGSKQPQTVSHEFSDLRFLTFGTSRTWGAAIPDRYKAYPYLMSENVTNLAIRASGPEIPALCTYSMVGEDEVYDVIVLEYYVRASPHLVELAKRLRQRFPDATIIFLKIWLPWQFYNHKERSSALTLMRRDLRFTANRFNPWMLREVAEQHESNSWAFIDHQDEAGRYVEEAADLVGGHVYSQPRPADHSEALSRYSHLFQNDATHYSEAGHVFVRDRVLELLRALNAKRSDRVNPWQDKDSCYNWLESGREGMPFETTGMKMNKFKEGDPGKHALEVVDPDDAIIRVSNPGEKDARLYLSHMVAGPAPQDMYPDCLVNVSSVTSAPITMTGDADPRFTTPVHVLESAYLGLIPGDETVEIRLQPLPDPEKGQPVRIVGVIVTPETDIELKSVSSQG